MADIVTYAVPQWLYRFRRLNGPKGSLLGQELDPIREVYIFCPTYASMNDPMEGKHTESAMLRSDEGHAATIQQVVSVKDALGIASFSEVVDHEPMWAHYADGFAGVCVRYNFRKLLRGLGDEVEFVRMAYNETAPVLLRDRKTAEQRAKLVLSIKSVRWASEREWRLMRPNSGKAFYNNLDCVDRIYLGSRVSIPDRAEVIRVANKLGGPVHAMELDHYALTFKRMGALLKKKPTKPKTRSRTAAIYRPKKRKPPPH